MGRVSAFCLSLVEMIERYTGNLLIFIMLFMFAWYGFNTDRLHRPHFFHAITLA